MYSFTGHGIAGIKVIAIESFDNQTPEFGVSQDLTERVLAKLLQDKTFKVSDRNSSDAILYGNVISVEDRPLTYTEENEVLEYEIVLSVSFILRKSGEAEAVWEGTLKGLGPYPYESGSLDERIGGISKAIDEITIDLINQLTSDW